jgi:deoxyribodipyrimidine photolyase-related protein
VRHHPKKIALILTAMRKFAAQLRAEGWQVLYTELDDTENSGSIVGELLRRAAETGAKGVLATEPGEWRLIESLGTAPVEIEMLPDDRFIASHAVFETWAEGRKQLRMEYFYREMRRRTGVLMEGDAPAGGQWNYDHDNRKPPPDDLSYSGPLRFDPDEETEAVLELVSRRFDTHFGDVRPFWFATTREQALQALSHFIKGGLPKFGDFQDAMIDGEAFLFHAVISPALNIGLLGPLEVCRAAEAAWKAGDVPINAAEGFIRQILGWREYVRGIYFLEGPEYVRCNALGHDRALPGFFWGGDTHMRCVASAVSQTREHAYAHHIQRLMVTGNFALLAGVDPEAVHDWYLSVYADAFEWVEAPNTLGMSQLADGGIIASKPYVSSGAYINRMSDHCKSCTYSVSRKTGDGACPFNLLYWHFLHRHRDRFSKNPRLGNIYATWERMDETRKKQVLQDAEAVLSALDAGDVV